MPMWKQLLVGGSGSTCRLACLAGCAAVGVTARLFMHAGVTERNGSRGYTGTAYRALDEDLVSDLDVSERRRYTIIGHGCLASIDRIGCAAFIRLFAYDDGCAANARDYAIAAKRSVMLGLGTSIR